MKVMFCLFPELKAVEHMVTGFCCSAGKLVFLSRAQSQVRLNQLLYWQYSATGSGMRGVPASRPGRAACTVAYTSTILISCRPARTLPDRPASRLSELMALHFHTHQLAKGTRGTILPYINQYQIRGIKKGYSIPKFHNDPLSPRAT